MRVLVTGGTGFIGSNVARALRERGNEVRISGVSGEQRMPDFEVLDLPSHMDLIGKIDALFHQAANNDTQLMDKDEMTRANVELTKMLFESVVKNGCKKIVYASSTAVYGNGPTPYKEDQELQPLNPYAESKVKMEEVARDFARANPDVRIVGLRYCNVYGPGESHKGRRASMIYQLAQQIKKGNPRLFKYGEQMRDFIYVKDVVRANLLALEAKENCVVNCGSGKAARFSDIVAILNRELGFSRETEYFDNPIADRYQSHTECDMTLAKEKLGFVPAYSIEKGIKDYIAEGLV